MLAGGAGVESDGQRGEIVLQGHREIEVRLFEAFVGGAGLEEDFGRLGMCPQPVVISQTPTA